LTINNGNDDGWNDNGGNGEYIMKNEDEDGDRNCSVEELGGITII